MKYKYLRRVGVVGVSNLKKLIEICQLKGLY